jgi:triosephosphate isomerase
LIAKVKALEHDMTILPGEELTVNQKNHFNVVENQLRDGLFQIEAKTGTILVGLRQYGL